MNFIPMAGSSDDSHSARGRAAHRPAEGRPTAARGTPAGGRAFDLWLNRGLHRIFDDIASEPVPDELLRLIEDDRRMSGGDPDAQDPATDPSRHSRSGD